MLALGQIRHLIKRSAGIDCTYWRVPHSCFDKVTDYNLTQGAGRSSTVMTFKQPTTVSQTCARQRHSSLLKLAAKLHFWYWAFKVARRAQCARDRDNKQAVDERPRKGSVDSSAAPTQPQGTLCRSWRNPSQGHTCDPCILGKISFRFTQSIM